MSTVVIIDGAKGIGKTYLGELLQEHIDVEYIDGDSSILGWMNAGVVPDPEDGWLEPMVREVNGRLETHGRVSVEVTDVWESERKLVQRLTEAGHRLVKVWLVRA